ncbi:uncharacterized protein ATNIH1004_008926 [Aspergillus tanneri]|nr:uncharacterized protein ATNIH1004_008926 [Aspergillus tanneri]KAA8644719.1 hypothetical protein ATNIH1004_008926 [Aspergillus tanneri]
MTIQTNEEDPRFNMADSGQTITPNNNGPAELPQILKKFLLGMICCFLGLAVLALCAGMYIILSPMIEALIPSEHAKWAPQIAFLMILGFLVWLYRSLPRIDHW